MLNEIKKDAQTRMAKSVEAFRHDLIKVRTGRASTALVDHLKVNYYGSEMPLTQVASVAVTDARSLTITPWEKQMVGRGREGDPRLRPRPDPEHRRHRDPHQPAAADRGAPQGAVQARARAKARTPRSPSATSAATPTSRSRNCSRKSRSPRTRPAAAEDDIQKLTDKAIKDVDDVVKAKEQELMAV